MVLKTAGAGQQNLCVFDTGIGTDNLGDYIIMDAVWDAIHEIFGQDVQPERIATHEWMPRSAYRRLRDFDLGIVGGTNILKSHMFIRANWRLRFYDMLFLKDVVLLGVGWQQYQGAVDPPSALLFRRILSSRFMHSARDEYTVERMRKHVRNIEYTACPTLWALTADRCAVVPTTKARNVILSLTYYRPEEADRALIRLLLREYENVYFWCQMDKDAEYLGSLSLGVALPVIADVGRYNELLAAGDVDVIGTRLHGGIRALQYGRRALILKVDNRATELAKKTNIPIVDRQDIDTIEKWIAKSPPVSIVLPWDAIDAWKTQFRGAG